jgi:hypothetical protein
MTTIKIVFENEIRRFKLDQSALGQSFDTVSKVVKESYVLDEFELKYVDDEQDQCLVTSEEEMKEALRFASKDKILKLFVTKKSKVESKTETKTPEVERVLEEPGELAKEEPKEELKKEEPKKEEPKKEEQEQPKEEPKEKEPKEEPKDTKEVKLPKLSGDTVHEGTTCDGCEQQPIRGLRYVCTSCKCNLCSSCESKNEHPHDHVLLKVKVPLPRDFDFTTSPFPKWINPAPQRDPPGMRPRAHFVRDCTVPDGSMFRPGQRVLKTWSIRNVGSVCWPRGTKLVFVNGTVKPSEDEEQPLVALAAPGETVDVSVKVQMPDKPGRYTGYYRLSYGSDGVKFGHRIWIDVLVSETALPEVAGLRREVAGLGREVQNVLGKALNVVSKVFKPESEVKSSPPPKAEGSAKTEVPVPKADSASEPAQPVAQPVVQPPFQYQAELEILAGMGFTDTEKSKAALLKHKGNVNVVANALLAQ